MRNVKGLFILILFIFIGSCKTTQKPLESKGKQALFTIDSLRVFPDEFLYAYEKSNNNKGEVEVIDDYLDLYIDFKLKILEAKAKGIDTTEAYKTELEGYIEEIKKPYLTAEKVNKELIEEAYSRLQKEINASHILIRVDPQASAEDTAIAYRKISEIKSKFEAGENFAKLARTYSEDPSAKTNAGLLGWFTAFQMVYPFESAAYETAVGQISPIVRTQFGYHLIKVNDERETLGRIKIAHIMKRFPPDASAEDSSKTEKMIREIYNRVKGGESWFILATKESDDLNTKDNGGSLPWFGAGNLPQTLETAAFELKNPGDISVPVRSPYGWHVLKLEDKRGVGSLQSVHESLSRRVQRDKRSELKEAEVIRKLKNENNFTKKPDAYSMLNSKPLLQIEEFKKKELQMTLFTISDDQYLIEDFLQLYDSSNQLTTELEKFEKLKLIQHEEENLETKYPEYRFLRQEYKDGLLLFEIMNQKVWGKIGKDSVRLREFYEANKNKYKSDEQLEIAKIVFSDTSSIKPFKKPINNRYFPLAPKKHYDITKSITTQLPIKKNTQFTTFVSIELPEKISKSDSVTLFKNLKTTFVKMEVVNLIYSDENKIYLQLFSEANGQLPQYNENIDSAYTEVIELSEDSKWKNKVAGEYIKTVAKNGRIELDIAIEKYAPREKTFMEARPEVMDDYQKHLENEWIKELKGKYSVNVNEKVLNNLKSNLEQ